MDWSHFEIARRPFWPVVDTASYFPSATHEAALAGINGAFDRRDPVVLLDGPAGTGKSLIARRWLERLPEPIAPLLLPNLQSPRPADLLQAILFDLNLPYRGLGEQELRLAVTEFLLAKTAAKTTTVIVVDEAQNLGPAAFEELRLLGNIESHGGSALFLLLVAQPRIQETLKHPDCSAFAQRIGSRCHLEPLTAEESAAYLRHQLKIAGREADEVIDADAIGILAGACQGIARLLNRTTTCAAELAAETGAESIDVEAALEAIGRFGLECPESTEETLVLKHPDKVKKPKAKIVGKRSA
ncbi:MAG TPA: AAA family ATPase [Urbifossiella sp.]